MDKGVIYAMQGLATFLGYLSSMTEGTGTVLDNTLIYVTSCTSWGKVHDTSEWPCLMIGKAGGAMKGNQHVRFPGGNLSSALLTIANLFGANFAEPRDGRGPDQSGTVRPEDRLDALTDLTRPASGGASLMRSQDWGPSDKYLSPMTQGTGTNGRRLHESPTCRREVRVTHASQALRAVTLCGLMVAGASVAGCTPGRGTVRPAQAVATGNGGSTDTGGSGSGEGGTNGQGGTVGSGGSSARAARPARVGPQRPVATARAARSAPAAEPAGLHDRRGRRRRRHGRRGRHLGHGRDDGNGPDGTCDIYAAANTPCGAAHSTVRALYSAYTGPLYQVKRSDGTTKDIPVGPSGFADSSVQDSFCSGSSCTIPIIYDQSPNGNHLRVTWWAYWLQSGGNPANATAAKITVGGHSVYGIKNGSNVAYHSGVQLSGTASISKGSATVTFSNPQTLAGEQRARVCGKPQGLPERLVQ